MPSKMAEAATGGGTKIAEADGTSLPNTICEVSKDGQTQVCLASLLGVGTTNNFSAVFQGLLSVESTLLTSETLEKNLGIRVDLEVLGSISVVQSLRRSRELTIIAGS